VGIPRAAPLVAQSSEVVLATTTSVRDAGLLQAILPVFEREAGLRVKVIAVGSGQAMELGRRGEADILILHDPRGEQAFMAEGLGIRRAPLMHNEFVVVGPPQDPAGIGALPTATQALRSIARARARFLSRGDRSGTHVKESALWEAVGVQPEGTWHLESGQGMGATLQIANELNAYTLTDLGTFLAHKSPLDMRILVDGDPILHNPYHLVLPHPERFPWINQAGAQALLDHLVSPETQSAIQRFGREQFGRSLFLPDAAKVGVEGGG
jgi:tungstate transport system substrate-binding protein